jgi:polyhydroxyalkanoate synthesis regulator phasin
MNMNEIDIDLLMLNPKHIHKMMGKEACDDKDDVLPLIDVPKHLRNIGKRGSENLKFFKETGSGLLKKYMDEGKTEPKNNKPSLDELVSKYTNKKEDASKKRHRTIAERLDKTQSNMYKNVDKASDAVTGAVKNFKNDVEKKGLGRTVGNRKDRTMDLIIDFINNNETMKNINRKLEPSADIIRSTKSGGIEAERERERKRDIRNDEENKLRKKRIDNFSKE